LLLLLGTSGRLRQFWDSRTITQPDLLSKREYNVLVLLVEGLEYKEIAEKLFISPATVRTHIASIYQKLHVRSKAQAIKLAYKNKWL
jgi:DNA-binding NarL/FixJ family response regulator